MGIRSKKTGIQDLESRIQNGIQEVRRRVRILSSGFWILSSTFWILSSGFWILNTGFWSYGCRRPPTYAEEILAHRAAKDRAFRDGSESPLKPADRSAFTSLAYFP